MLYADKFATYTINDFKVMVIHCCYTYPTDSIFKTIKILNAYGSKDLEDGLYENAIKDSMALKREVISYAYIVNNDLKKMQSLNISYYDAYISKNPKHSIHVFTFERFYRDNKDDLVNLNIKRAYNRATTLTNFFYLG